MIYDRPDARIYANDAALPRAFVVGARRRVDDAYAAITADVVRPARATRSSSRAPPRASRGSPGPAQILHTENDRQVRRDAHHAARASSSSPSPGRPAGTRVMGGEELKVERVDYLYRGVRVPAGTHIVEFTYRPLSWRIGWIVSLVAFVALLGGLLWRPWRGSDGAAARARRRARDRRAARAALPRGRLLGARVGRRTRAVRPWVGRLDVGVAIFFLLSGYLLYGPFLRGRIRVGAYALAAGAADRARRTGSR